MKRILALLAFLSVGQAADAQFRPFQRLRDALHVRGFGRDVCVGPNCPPGIPSPPPFVAVPAEAPKVMPSSKVVGAPGDRIIRLAKKLQIVRGKIVEGLVSKGVDRADAEKVVGELGDGTLLKLILEHLDDIMAIVLKLLPLFMDKVALYHEASAYL